MMRQSVSSSSGMLSLHPTPRALGLSDGRPHQHTLRVTYSRYAGGPVRTEEVSVGADRPLEIAPLPLVSEPARKADDIGRTILTGSVLHARPTGCRCPRRCSTLDGPSRSTSPGRSVRIHAQLHILWLVLVPMSMPDRADRSAAAAAAVVPCGAGAWAVG